MPTPHSPPHLMTPHIPFSLFSPPTSVHVSYLDGKGNVEPQGAGGCSRFWGGYGGHTVGQCPPPPPPSVTPPPPTSVPSAVSTLSDDLLKYYQNVTRAVLGDDPHLMKVNNLGGGWGLGQKNIWGGGPTQPPLPSASHRWLFRTCRPTLRLLRCCPISFMSSVG